MVEMRGFLQLAAHPVVREDYSYPNVGEIVLDGRNSWNHISIPAHKHDLFYTCGKSVESKSDIDVCFFLLVPGYEFGAMRALAIFGFELSKENINANSPARVNESPMALAAIWPVSRNGCAIGNAGEFIAFFEEVGAIRMIIEPAEVFGQRLDGVVKIKTVNHKCCTHARSAKNKIPDADAGGALARDFIFAKGMM